MFQPLAKAMKKTRCARSSLSSVLLKRRRPIIIVLGVISVNCYLLVLLRNKISSSAHRHYRDTDFNGLIQTETRHAASQFLLPNEGNSTDKHDFVRLNNQVISTGKLRNIKITGTFQTSTDAEVSNYYEYLTYKLNNSETATINVLPQNCPDKNHTSFCSFYPTISVEEALSLRKLLEAFVAAADEEHVRYFIAYGTLLGAYRHGGLIPWDDDLDVMISADYEDEMSHALRSLAPKYGVVRYGKRLKFFFSNAGDNSNDDPLRSYYGFAFPSLDVFLYDNSSDSLWDVAYGGEVALTTVFPLTTVQFWGLNVSAPRDALSYFEELGYNVDVCQSNSYDHRLEEKVNEAVAVSCEELKQLYPDIKIKLK